MPTWAIALAAGLLAAAYWGLKPAVPDVERIVDSAAAPRYLAQEAVWQRHDEAGELLLQARADTLRGYSGGLIEIDRIDVAQLGTSDRWQLDAPSGRILPGHDRLELEAPVSGRFAPQRQAAMTLQAGTVWVLPGERRLGSDAPVRLESPQRSLRADRFSAGWDEDRIQFSGQVEARHAPSRP